MEGVFFKPNNEYTNKLDPVRGYLEQLTHYIQTKKKCSPEIAKERAQLILKNNFKDKIIKFFDKEENGDRSVKDGSLLGYIKSNIDNENILVPTFTSYTNGKVRRSILSEFIVENVKVRSIAKKESQKAKADGNLDLAESKNNEQNNKKTYNNALSGLFGQSACILYNPTAHSTLTSITRTITSLTNACNERLVAGNRYLPRASDVFRSVVYESTYVDQDLVKQAVDLYGLHLPSPKETADVLRYSSDLYFMDDVYYRKYVIPFLEGLSPYQLAGICYTGDMFHQRKFNNSMIHKLFEDLTVVVEPDGTNLEDHTVLYGVNEAILYFAHTLFNSRITGMGKNYEKMNEIGIAKALYLTCKNIEEVVLKYKVFFNAFFMTPILPINSHRLRNMRRRVVVLSDTDSSAFTMDEWVKWWCNGFEITDKSVGLAGAITYLVSGNIVNQLAILSKSMNVEERLLNVLAMKNEFLWSLHVPAEVSKHYYAYTIFQEGNVFSKPEVEVKGVHLKNSAVPVSVVKRGTDLMETILSTLHGNKKLKLAEVIQEVIDIENMIIDSVNKGEAVYLKKSKIKDHTAYAQGPDKSPYQRHTLWLDVFEPKYGQIQDPPYDVVKFPTTVLNKTALKAWVESIEDVEMQGRLDTWLTKHNKNTLPTLYLNEMYVQGSAIPKEIASVINVRQIVFDCTLQLRVILETLGMLLNHDLLVKEQFHIDEVSGSVTEVKEFRHGSRTKGYECSSKGDKRFSAFYAKLPNGRSIEDIYQTDVKGYGSIEEGKGRPPLNPDANCWEAYLGLWRIWAKHNSRLIEELRIKASEHNYTLNDIFANTEINQARALATILNETRNK